MGGAMIAEINKPTVTPDSSKTNFLVVISREWHHPKISLKVKSSGDPKETGGIRIGVDLEDYLQALIAEWRAAARWRRMLPHKWVSRMVTNASFIVIEKLKRESVKIV
jgi:hypothetical protein